MLDGDVKSGNIQTKVIHHESLGHHRLEKVICDPSRLAQILTNLLSNAFKFTRQQKIRVTEVTCGASTQIPTEEDSMISLQWSNSGKAREDATLHPEWGEGEVIYLYFLVRDTGSGMTQPELGRLFTRFFQASSTTYLKHGGSGLGLYISRELVEKHGGQIGVRSTPGEGSTFAFYIKTRRTLNTVSLPLGLVRANAVSPPAVLPSAEEAFAPSEKGKNEVRYEILLVEDNAINQRVLSHQLRKAGCVVHVANDGIEALKFLEKFEYRCTTAADRQTQKDDRLTIDAILMDWNMPNMDGVSCTRQIRSQEKGRDITQRPMLIIGITANARPEQLLEARDAGMDDVLSKPFLMGDLMAKIRELVVK
jgi:CheY-like chemotaxis protein